ncbi:MAG TPA: aspartate carbamoyltransferase regulatory subunit [Rhabdochlamydiaceae bacterium]|nr:aspartate carbamoyltransferase regulatory subunit [Rhabdochlamydiaceae bacterium]
MEKVKTVAAIKDGTVIDHIPSGQALKILQLLRLSHSQCKITVGLRLKSLSMNFKDLIKIENRFLNEKEIYDVAVFTPDATINIIQNYKVSSKIKAKLAPQIENILICPNARCITNSESIDTLFFIEEFHKNIYLRCFFCEKKFQRDEVREYRL